MIGTYAASLCEREQKRKGTSLILASWIRVTTDAPFSVRNARELLHRFVAPSK